MTDLIDDRTDDRMDQRLAAAGRRWQAEQPVPTGVPLERLDEPIRPARTRRAALAAAAAVVLVGGAGAGVLRATGDGGSSGPSNQPSSSPTTQGTRVTDEVVPWRDLTATHPKIGHRVNGKLVTKYDGIWANGHISGHLHPGDTLVFIVVLDSSTDVVLNPCPDFSIAFGRKGFTTGQLNCRQVQYRSVIHKHTSQGDRGRRCRPTRHSASRCG